MENRTKTALQSKRVWSLLIALIIKVLGILSAKGILPAFVAEIFSVISEDLLSLIFVALSATFGLGANKNIKGITVKRR